MLLYWFLAVFSVVAPAVSQSVCNDTQCRALWGWGNPYYYNLLEGAMLNDSSNLFGIQTAIFPTNGELGSLVASEMYVDLTVAVNIFEDDFCLYDFDSYKRTFSWSNYSQEYAWTNTYTLTWLDESILDTFGERELMSTVQYEGIIPLAELFGIKAAKNIIQDSKPEYAESDEDDYQYGAVWLPAVWLTLKLDHLKCNPEKEHTESVALYLVSWLKQYAIAQGKPDTWNENNRGEVDVAFKTANTRSELVDNLTLAIFVLMNLSVVLVAMRITPGLYSKVVNRLSEETRLIEVYRMFYWGGVTVIFFVVIVLYLADVIFLIWLHSRYYYYYYYYLLMYVPRDILRQRWIVLTLKAVIVVVEMITCTVICKRNKKGIEFPFSCFANICCCCCFCCKCCSRNIKYQAVQTLALWAIVSFIQHLAMSAVPIFFIVILHPAEALSVLAVCSSALFCIIMLVSHVLYMCRMCGARVNRCAPVAMFVVQMLLIISLSSVVIAIVLLYLIMLAYGAKFSGFGGLFVPLVPSLILAVIGWFIKNRLLPGSAMKTPQNGDVNKEARDMAADEQTPLVYL